MPRGGWYPDPAQRHELRYWDGQRWTNHVTDDGVPGTCAYRETAPPPAEPDKSPPTGDSMPVVVPVTGAGTSALLEADRADAKIKRLQKRKDSFTKGAEGEAITSDALKTLPATYWRFDDRAIAGSRANIDHIVVGPSGVFVVDSKNLSGGVRIRYDTLWSGRHPLRREVETLHWEAAQVAAVLGTPVTPMFCFVKGTLPAPAVDIAGVRATTPGHIAATIANAPPSLTFDKVTATAAKVDRGFPPRSTTTPTRRPNRRPSSPSSAPKRTRRSRPRQRRGRNELGLGGMAALAAVLLVVWLKPDVVGKVLNLAIPPHAAPALAAEFVCPAEGAGWQLQPAWPGTPPANAGYQLDWAPAEDNAAWTALPEWRDEAVPPNIDAIAPGATVKLRARVSADDQRRVDSAEQPFTAPADPC